VWVYLAQSYRSGGTAAEYTVVPAHHFVVLADSVDATQAAGLGIPGITGHRAVTAGGNVAGSNVLVTGASNTYATGETSPQVPFWQLGFKNITVRFLSNDDFTDEANDQAARDLTAALQAGDLRYDIRATYPLERIVDAHEDVEQASGTSRVLLEI
jgi:NADPH2:quinone reductase